jgi:hypothetical protein
MSKSGGTLLMKRDFSEKELLELVEAFSLKIKDELSISFRKESIGSIREDISFTNPEQWYFILALEHYLIMFLFILNYLWDNKHKVMSIK